MKNGTDIITVSPTKFNSGQELAEALSRRFIEQTP